MAAARCLSVPYSFWFEHFAGQLDCQQSGWSNPICPIGLPRDGNAADYRRRPHPLRREVPAHERRG
eukprot:9057767-Pyramimonas_sp.AAC.1